MVVWLESARAEGWEVGVGPRFVMESSVASSPALQLVGRRTIAPAWTIEAGACAAPFPTEPSNLSETLVTIAYEAYPDTSFRQPIRRERAALRAAVDWSFGPRPHVAKVTGGLHAFAGVEGRLVEDRFASINPDYEAGRSDEPAVVSDDPSWRFVPSPAVGVGLDAWLGPRVGLRWTFFDRVAVEPEPDYGNRDAHGDPIPLGTELTQSMATSFDLLVAL